MTDSPYTRVREEPLYRHPFEVEDPDRRPFTVCRRCGFAQRGPGTMHPTDAAP